jgi:plasmid stabilization system protein ParE
VPISLILTEKAQEDLDDAYQWYEDQELGLGKEFIRCIDAKIAKIKRYPLHHQVVQSDRVRRALTNRFPFSIYFVDDEEIIVIFAILHQKRSPDFWKSRL